MFVKPQVGETFSRQNVFVYMVVLTVLTKERYNHLNFSPATGYILHNWLKYDTTFMSRETIFSIDSVAKLKNVQLCTSINFDQKN